MFFLKVRQCCWIHLRLSSALIIIKSFVVSIFLTKEAITPEPSMIFILGNVTILFCEMLGVYALIKEKPTFLFPLLICSIIIAIVMVLIAGKNYVERDYHEAVKHGFFLVVLWFVASVFYDYYMESNEKIQLLMETQTNPGTQTLLETQTSPKTPKNV